jgi:hypothetical protein
MSATAGSSDVVTFAAASSLAGFVGAPGNEAQNRQYDQTFH